MWWDPLVSVYYFSYILVGPMVTLLFCKVMEVLMSLQGSEMEADDPTTSYMLQVRSCNFKKQHAIYRRMSCVFLIKF